MMLADMHVLSLLPACAGLPQPKEGMSLCAFANCGATRVLRLMLWLSEPQLLHLALGCADHCSSTAAGLLPAHACPPKPACPSSGRCSACAGCDSARSFLKSRKITRRCRSQARGLFLFPSEECSNDGM